MAAKVVQLCEELVNHLNAGTYSQSFTSTRRNVWEDDLASATGVQITVLPAEVEITNSTRTATQRRYRINVIVQKRFATTDRLTEEDAMLQLVEELEDDLYDKSFGGFGFDQFNDQVGTRTLIEVEAVGQQRMFRSILQVSYLGE